MNCNGLWLSSSACSGTLEEAETGAYRARRETDADVVYWTCLKSYCQYMHVYSANKSQLGG